MKNQTWYCILILIFTTLSIVAPSAEALTHTSCDESTQNEINCVTQVAQNAAIQLKKDFIYLTTLARSRNVESVKYFKMGDLAFQNFRSKNCESEGHDALGGSLQEVIEQTCRRDITLQRRTFFERIAIPHPLGRTAEKVLGRPICTAFQNEAKSTDVGSIVKLADVELLRLHLDKTGAQAASSGQYSPNIETLLRAIHIEAENQNLLDATYTCRGILEGFCHSINHTNSLEESNKKILWLSRCQTEIRRAFYKRATNRLWMMKRD